MLIHSSAILPILFPISLITISFERPPYSVALLLIVGPFSLESLSVVPHKLALSVSFPFQKLPRINTIDILLAACNLDVIFIASLEDLPFSDSYTLSVFHLVLDLSEIDIIFMGDDFEIFIFDQLFDVELLVHWFVSL